LRGCRRTSRKRSGTTLVRIPTSESIIPSVDMFTRIGQELSGNIRTQVYRDMKHDRATASAIQSCLLVLLSFCNPIFGQSSRESKTTLPQGGEEHPLHLCVQLVGLDIEVDNGYGWPVSDLRHVDFAVFEDGKEQPIAYFEQGKTWDAESEAPGHYR